MDKTIRLLIVIFLLFIGVVLFMLFFIGFLLRGSSSPSSSNDSEFPIIIFVPIFFGILVPIMAAIRRRR
ncbi:MAG: hypothetical protein JSW11_02245 [Candidatus Heimdallarchaeota archaeon]|nr:MAG: hypothetical protein JSW11_02245 [Candidatus Heimdallarchaeota archaeon]